MLELGEAMSSSSEDSDSQGDQPVVRSLAWYSGPSDACLRCLAFSTLQSIDDRGPQLADIDSKGRRDLRTCRLELDYIARSSIGGGRHGDPGTLP